MAWKRVLIAFAAFLGLAARAGAEERPAERRAADVSAGAHLGIATLLDARDRAIGPGAGLAMPFGWRPTPWTTVGGEVGYYRYGWTSREERFRLVDERGMSTPLVQSYERKTDLVPVLLIARLQPPRGLVRPYVQGVAGINIFKTTVDYAYVEGDEDDLIDGLAQIAWSAGVEGGLELVIDRRGYDSPRHTVTTLISLGVRRLWNSTATFGLPGPLAAGSRTSRSGLFVTTLGLTFRADAL